MPLHVNIVSLIYVEDTAQATAQRDTSIRMYRTYLKGFFHENNCLQECIYTYIYPSLLSASLFFLPLLCLSVFLSLLCLSLSVASLSFSLPLLYLPLSVSLCEDSLLFCCLSARRRRSSSHRENDTGKEERRFQWKSWRETKRCGGREVIHDLHAAERREKDHRVREQDGRGGEGKRETPDKIKKILRGNCSLGGFPFSCFSGVLRVYRGPAASRKDRDRRWKTVSMHA